ncbi:NifB/NifX family molybdenum-iron cluster-binding protein [Methanolobus sp. ZRKC3]|uniref:NifB/NifX family molybdenum-iron cluster-binding protein n=1 Tax=Methanolobus sp. ZRKC3 TaxID=3125786 RepID=UPI003251CC5B
MKICVTATSEGLNAPVDPHFGRCQYFVIVDSDTMEFESIANTSSSASGGAGIKAAQQILNKNIGALITGSVGPNAFPILSSENIEVYGFATGSVSEAVSSYNDGMLESIGSANSPGKSGNQSHGRRSQKQG